MKEVINKFLLAVTGYQLAKPHQTLHFEGAEKRRFDNEFVLKAQPYGNILDIGGGPGSFAKKHFKNVSTIDQRDMGDVDYVGDIHHLSHVVPQKSFDTVICTEVFEHTKEPWVAIKEIYKILKPGGLFIGTGPLTHELHGEEYGDYWRITPQGWEQLLRGFENIHIETRGLYPQINHVAVSARKPSA
jgi:ubiquinone/menaquinone biosynthesis C-methylase UbiE